MSSATRSLKISTNPKQIQNFKTKLWIAKVDPLQKISNLVSIIRIGSNS